MKHHVVFRPQGSVTHAPDGVTVLNAANWLGLPIDSTCGGRGTCGKCRVRLLQGAALPTSADLRFLNREDISAGWRLACCALVHGECEVDVPRLMTSPKAALLGYGQHVLLHPNVRKVPLSLPQPSLADQRSDVRRVSDALREEGYAVRVPPSVWRALPRLLRDSAFHVTAVVCGDELIAVEPGDTTCRLYGLALDLGTTTVVAALVDLKTGAVLAVRSALNGQAPYGADIISRVSYTMQEPDGLATLQAAAVATVNTLIDGLLAETGVARDLVYEVVIVGNTTMLSLLLGVDPEPIAVFPFIPAVEDAVTLPAAALGLRLHPEARVATLPHLGAYVGADITAGVLATGLVRPRDNRVRLYIDVGTNGEIVLGGASRALATAAPAGPAFEGAQIRSGMRASEGAIEGVRITDDVHLQVISAERPLGICGSGLIDAVAELAQTGLVDASGRLKRPHEVRDRLPDALVDRLIEVDGRRAFLLSDPEDGVVITQADIRALQFAKAAVMSGVRALMERLGVTEDDLHEILLAGSFGSYINPSSARAIGLVPWTPLDRIVAVGNAAGEGAKIALLSSREREAAGAMAQFIEYVELSGQTGYNDLFTDALGFPTPERIAV